MSGSSRSVAICHLDLGLGGAERFIVDSALELKALGHSVHVFTSHFDPARCLEDTAELDIRVIGSWLPRTIFGLFTVLCSLARMFMIALHIVRLKRSGKQEYDIIVIDQVSSIIGFLQHFTSAQIIFYGHFPDQLLAQKTNTLRAAYRAPFNRLEASSTAASDVLLVNSKFTRDTFRETFPKLQARTDIQVLYPAVSLPTDEELEQDIASWESDLDEELVNWIHGGSMLLSLNRFERKKNIKLALEAVREVIDRHALSSGACSQVRLIVAGGWDPRVAENVSYERDLKRYADQLQIEDRVVFLRNISEKQRRALLAACQGVLYTPDREHFGIVPLEAMARARPVIAVASGGPLETILHRKTGFLSKGVPMEFANSVVLLLTMAKEDAKAMSQKAREHVAENFSRSGLREKWRDVVNRTVLPPSREDNGKKE